MLPIVLAQGVRKLVKPHVANGSKYLLLSFIPGYPILCRLNLPSGILSDHSGVQVRKRQTELTRAYT